jgi:DNA-binding NarL/FixJ family response regulator
MPSRAPSFRVILVDDFQPWRVFESTALHNKPELQIVGEASDGLQAVQKAQELQPDLILLDIGLPTLNGIEAAGRIRRLSPASKILFVSENRSPEIVEKALGTGASGYVVKSDAAGDLLRAVTTVLSGERFVSASLSGRNLTEATLHQTGAHPDRDNVVTFSPPQKSTRHHDVIFYSDDRHFLDSVARFIGAALKAGNAAIVVATESHRENLVPTLQAYGVDMSTAIEQGRYIAFDAAAAISEFVIDNTVDKFRFMNAFSSLISKSLRAANGDRPHVSVFGEGSQLLRAQGKVEAAIQDEQLCNQLVKMYDVDIMCAYSIGGLEDHIFQQICAVHSAVYSQ